MAVRADMEWKIRRGLLVAQARVDRVEHALEVAAELRVMWFEGSTGMFWP